MKKTNLDRWNEYQAILKKRDQEYIKSVIDTLPEVFYTVQPAFNTPDYYQVGINKITGTHYWHRTGVIWLNGNGKRPTGKTVEALKNYVENPIQYQEDQIGVRWERQNYSGSINWPEFKNRTGIFLNLEEVTAIVESKRQRHITETAQLEAGTHKKCMYCGAVREIKDIHYDTIISQNWKNQGFKSPPRPYCKDKPCAGYDQMGHEG